MTDRQVLVDQLNLDVESKKNESVAQKKYLDDEFNKNKLRRIEALTRRPASPQNSSSATKQRSTCCRETRATKTTSSKSSAKPRTKR